MRRSHNMYALQQMSAARAIGGGGWLKGFLWTYVLVFLIWCGLVISTAGIDLGSFVYAVRGSYTEHGFVLVLLSLGLALVPCIVLHELGHLIFGVLAGYAVTSLSVGPLMIVKQARGLRMTWQPWSAHAGFFLGYLPREMSHRRLRGVIMVLGGPALNLLCAFEASRILTAQPQPGQSWLLSAFAVCSWTLGLVNLMPISRQGEQTDGALMHLYASSGQQVERHLALGALQHLKAIDIRPRDWDPELVAQALAIPDWSRADCSARIFAFEHLADCEDIPRAGTLIDDLVSNQHRYPGPLGALILLEGAYFEAHHRMCPEKARALFEQAADSFPVKFIVLKVETAVLLAEGEFALALEAFQEYLQVFQSETVKVEASYFFQSEQEWRDETVAALRKHGQLGEENIKHSSIVELL